MWTIHFGDATCVDIIVSGLYVIRRHMVGRFVIGCCFFFKHIILLYIILNASFYKYECLFIVTNIYIYIYSY